MDIYKEEILEHYRHPHNQGEIADADYVQQERNASCGDELKFWIKYDGKKIIDVKFQGQGCAISQAAASMLTDEIKGMTLKQVNALTKEDVLDILNIDLSPTRLKCALLSLQGIQNAINK